MGMVIVQVERLHRGLLCLCERMMVNCLLLIKLILSPLDELFDVLILDLKLHFLVLLHDLSFHLVNLHHLLEDEVLVLGRPVLSALFPALVRRARVPVASLGPKGLHVGLIEGVLIVARYMFWVSLGADH